jgi:predicted amidohydrolase YtcJ
VLIRNAEVGGRSGVDVRLGRGLITELGALTRRPGEPVLDAEGGALIPGLHDHHVHLRAWAAARASVPLNNVSDPRAFDEVIRVAAESSPARDWLRGVGWHESTGGPLDRHRLDALTGSRPARIQHRTGALWVLNSAALTEVRAADSKEPGIERDETGGLTGRLWRLDGWLRARAPRTAGDLPGLAAEAAGWGVTGFTDATPGRDQADVDAFAQLHATSGIPQRLLLMSPPRLTERDGVQLGPQKIILDDRTLPTAEELAVTIRAAQKVAIHCVTADQLAVATAAMRAAPGPHRIEHAGVVPPGFADELAEQGVAVVTNPGFVAERGDDYRRDVAPEEQPWLYPCRSLLAAGVTVAAATDAPYGPPDPWQVIAAAVTRRLGESERIDAAAALGLFLKDPQDLRKTRTVTPGAPADLCLLRGPLTTVLTEPSSDWVRTVLIAGRDGAVSG